MPAMKHSILRCVAALLLLAGVHALPRASSRALPCVEPLRVVTTIPDLADIVREVGGDLVDVESIAKGRENIHSVRIKPSHVVAMNKADLFVQVGLSLEHAWVPALLQASRNKRIQPGMPGFLNISEGWEPIQVPESLSRRQGTDLHPQGNPHINLDPRGGRHMAQAVLDALGTLLPDAKPELEARHASYAKRLDEAEARWRALAARVAGEKVVAYHASFDYLMLELGVEIAGSIEPKPGVPPTPRDLARLITRMQSEGIGVVVTAFWSNNRSVAEVARKSGARVVELPDMVGGVEGAESWIAMMDLIHERLAQALSGG